MNVLIRLQALLNDPSVVLNEEVQSLWSGYGQIIRCKSKATQQSYIVKVITPNEAGDHPRGWNTSTSHQRKLKSYQVEANFYQHYAHVTDEHSKVPKLIASSVTTECTLLVMEDLDSTGYTERKGSVPASEIQWQDLANAIKWLAYFHARFMGDKGNKLWSVGTYWHLATRQDELSAMPDSAYKSKASSIDDVLKKATFQTLIHGDAKFENLCFHPNGEDVAAVDFQYVGRGAGVKDLMYLVGSCLNEDKLIAYDALILDEYLKHLKKALMHYKSTLNFEAICKETKILYPVAWADFYRFLLGWNPESWKICDYMKKKSVVGLTLL